ncbi:phosphoribosylamine--glycine ligase [Desulfobotulus alkaliphilus]|uniref:Multifunctional fusion protein n=1 Tax=Desulfobotulus alkaliphilus TaxID=622671 RepID=A0A562S342_9BACT|nr:phosphoribosylamine--glycine ligase [Desulfobotulus alkaliphilus]TWI75608.1 phosphoribosylamine--glycine ligase [Desulfobotulus alkaliphilus]
MNILVIGSGGREHALVWKISQSSRAKKIFCAPGNPGIAAMAQCVDIPADAIEELKTFALSNAIDLTVVGPEVPLAAGIVDLFEASGLRVFGPSAKAAELEASKAFAKDIMVRYGIPTAKGQSFKDADQALAFAQSLKGQVVVKADGLAAGKGVVVCFAMEEAEKAIQSMLGDKAFGEAGATILVEERLEGEEASIIALTDGKTILTLPSSQDHKAVYDGDKGPNTGGMGAYSPAPVVDFFMQNKIAKEVLEPAVRAMAAEGRPFKGVLYAGMMIHRDQIRVLEFNARFGDPETQPLMLRIQSDIVELMEAVVEERLHTCSLKVDPRAAVCVVMAAGGYPGSYGKGESISGLNEAASLPDTMVFHAGTTTDKDAIVSSGGRVLGVSALGDSVQQATVNAYKAVSCISFNHCHYRKDIAMKAIEKQDRAPRVGIVMGSDSDLPVMMEVVSVLKKFDVPYEMTIASAHRTPEKAALFASSARGKGMGVIIAGAGHAAHLAGAMAAGTTLPIIGVPIDSSALQGLDALLSTVQMPPGVPVATVAIGKPGAYNAGILAVQMLAIADAELAAKLTEYKKEMADKVEAKAKALVS